MPPTDTQSKTHRKWLWLEEYQGCGCSNMTATKREALGYCPKHGTGRRRITKIPNNGMEVGFA